MKLMVKAYLRIAAEDWRDKYDWVGDFSWEDFAKVKLEGKWGFVDKKGNVVIPLKYESVGSFHEGLARVKLDKWGFVDETGKEVVPPKYDYVGDFREGLAEVGLNDTWGFVDKKGKEIPLWYVTAVKLGGDIDRILEIGGSL